MLLSLDNMSLDSEYLCISVFIFLGHCQALCITDRAEGIEIALEMKLHTFAVKCVSIKTAHVRPIAQQHFTLE